MTGRGRRRPTPGRQEAPPGPAASDYLGMPVGAFLDALASPAGPTGGAAAALAVALAAGLAAMSARLSARHLPSAPAIAEEAERLRGRAAPLAQADTEGYRAVLEAMRGEPGQGQRPEQGQPGRAERVAAALSQASAAPMTVAEIAARVAALAATLAADGNPAVRGDAITSAVLAAAAARAAAALVAINLAGADDHRPSRAELLAAEAADHARRAQEDTPRRSRYL